MERGVTLRSGQDAGLAQFGRDFGAVSSPFMGGRRGRHEEQEQESVPHHQS
jgi:hypothetical protein